MDRYLDDYGELDSKAVIADLKKAIEYVKDVEYTAAAELLNDIMEALYNAED